ncbi:MAG: hypothetical protein B7X04_02570 [Parcubacteria group bacterium 21-54-25]|nr:MAG: hypothetical protein B7X04_02570 [Parcubacteria group bacterium 21-54-25]HQU07761.1 STAS/SEC14 domain-containing protein [Candidatus Paceibacterota bacterium]
MTESATQNIVEKRNEVRREEDILVYRLNVPIDDKEAERLDAAGRIFLDRNEASRVLIDIRHSTDFSSAARRRWVAFLQHPAIVKTAIFGGNTFIRTLAMFVIGASQRKNIKFFATEQEARTWLVATGEHA